MERFQKSSWSDAARVPPQALQQSDAAEAGAVDPGRVAGQERAPWPGP